MLPSAQGRRMATSIAMLHLIACCFVLSAADLMDSNSTSQVSSAAFLQDLGELEEAPAERASSPELSEAVEEVNASAATPTQLYFSPRRRSFSGFSPRRRTPIWSSPPRRRAPIWSSPPRRRTVISPPRRRTVVYSPRRRYSPGYYPGGGGYYPGGGGGNYPGGGSYPSGGGSSFFDKILGFLLFLCCLPFLFCFLVKYLLCSGGSDGRRTTAVAPQSHLGAPLMASDYPQPSAPPLTSAGPLTNLAAGPSGGLTNYANSVFARGSSVPIPREVAADFVNAVRAEYFEGLGGAVGSFLERSGVSEAVGQALEREETAVRTAQSREQAEDILDEMTRRWQVR
eukprot:TRINITY_DN16786_c0_g2_i1.p1 TRINITY_DN16786_c0_g2~~TRINITY_DN16786_c0_g2_i1.p1  ORF type:complete len:341 (-),score=51.55 TRINITY_DN16786_c0_g2_i1:197-1219(-)